MGITQRARSKAAKLIKRSGKVRNPFAVATAAVKRMSGSKAREAGATEAFMAIQYVCDRCGDFERGYYSDSRSQWEPPQAWVCYEQVQYVGDEDKGQYRHFCSTACLIAYIEVPVKE